MAKRKIRTTVCSFCLREYPDKELYTVRLPMHRGEDGTTRGEYRTPCCNKCVDLKETKERILGILLYPEGDKPTQGKKKDI